MEAITQKLFDIIEDLSKMCTHCGKCCESEVFFLTDIETPLIAQELHYRGGLDLLKAHIKANPYMFNRWGKYIFQFEK